MTAATGSQRRRRRSGQSIIGFTEAELGLFIALLFFGLTLLGRSGAPTVGRSGAMVAVPDSLTKDNPRVARLLALAEKLDSLERALRTAYARDSALASQLAVMQRQRDSLRVLKSSSGTLAVGAPGASENPPAPSAQISAATLGEQLIQVERAIATSTLTRTSSASALASLALETSSTRQRLDSIAPSLAQALTPTTTPLAAAAAAPATAPSPAASPAQRTTTVAESRAASLGMAGAPAVAPATTTAAARATAGSPGAAVRAASAGGAASAAAAATARAVASYTPAEVRRALELLAESRSAGNGLVGNGATPQVGNGLASGGGAGSGASGGGGGGAAPRGASRAVSTADLGAKARSTQTPTCVELRVDTGTVAEIAILASDLYDVRGKAGPLTTVLTVLAPELASAKKNDCRHRVRVRVGPQLSADDYVLAVNALLPYFNTELARDRKRP